MKIEIKVPTMGESISSATVSSIIKKSGTVVKAEDEIIELETEKVNQVIYAPADGVLTLFVERDQEVKIGEVIGSIDESGVSSESVPQTKEIVETPPPKRSEPVQVSEEVVVEIGGGGKATTGSRNESRSKMPKIRRVIAERLLHAVKTTAMLTTFNEVDMSSVIQIREKHKDDFMKKHEVKLGFMSFFVKAVVSALQAFPSFNSYIDGEDLVERHYYDIGIAVGTDRGLFVPVVRNCDQLSFAEIEREILNYAKLARDGKLSADALLGGGFTITNGGTYGSLLSTPILNPPQVGILGMHAIQDRPVAINGKVEIRKMMYLALSYDHRVVDGKEAVTFLVHIKKELEDLSRLILDM